MNRLTLLFALCVAAPLYAQDDEEEVTIPAADEWYKADYAPLYNDKPWDKVDEIVAFYAETLHEHGEGGGSHNAREWASGLLEEWKIEGWIRSELADLKTDMLNPTTASFKAKWRDYYAGGNIGYECSWYLADFTDGKWVISEYAVINCSDHGL
ncbi:MAG: hypothetical protein ACR2QU_00970 [Gammaproteobacteria bacterium]